MGEAHTPHFYDVGICEPIVKPQNQLRLSLETPGYIKKSRKVLEHVLNVIYIYIYINDYIFRK